MTLLRLVKQDAWGLAQLGGRPSQADTLPRLPKEPIHKSGGRLKDTPGTTNKPKTQETDLTIYRQRSQEV